MEELSKHGKLGMAAARAGMDPKTAAKYRDVGKFPSELKQPRSWRTREDPFEEDWPAIAARLAEAPELEAKTLFELLLESRPEKYEPGQVRTLQRRVRQWRATAGPDKEVFFAQVHRPGEAMQTDFTWGNELDITIAGAPLRHLLCHPVLPFSNWEWVTVCGSESMAAIKRGVQAALFRLGRVPHFHQTDNSTAATHDIPSGKRDFNQEYLALVAHFGMKPRTIEPGQSHQNGDAEALAAMRPLSVGRLIEYSELEVPVTSWSTIRVCHNAYSVPSRLRGERVRVRLYEDRLEIYYGSRQQLSIERLRGRHGHRINYRHIIWSLVQKPGAFAQYRYREELFPTLTFRRAYDALAAKRPARGADLEYLRILHLAASTMESIVEAALQRLLEEGQLTSGEQVKALVLPAKPEVPELAVPSVDLRSYDALLETREEVAS